MQNFSQFIDKLVEEKGFDEKDPDILTQIKSDLQERLEDRVNAMIAATLPENTFPEFEKILDKGNEAEIVSFVKKHIPDIEEKVASELLNFRSVYLG